MGIKAEFERAIKEEFGFTVEKGGIIGLEIPNKVALWAAKWMAERCARVADVGVSWTSDEVNGVVAERPSSCCSEEALSIAEKIRQLAKELS